MNYTNLFNLPRPLAQAIIAHALDYDKGRSDISVTSLIKPPRVYQLEERYDNVLTQDVSDMIYMFLGNIGHNILETVTLEDCLQETRLYITIDGYIIGGQIDLWEPPHTLYDYKLTSFWAVKDEKIKPEWEAQLNIYKLLLESLSKPVNKLKIAAVLRDWNINSAMRDKTYPQKGVKVLNVPIWNRGRILDFTKERIQFHKEAEKLEDNDLVFCNPKERWEKPAVYAVEKEGRKKAVRLLSSQVNAEEYMDEKEYTKKKGYGITFRPGESTRCERYCIVRSLCNQYALISRKNT